MNYKKNTEHYIVEEFNMNIIFKMQNEQLFDFSLTKKNHLWAICPYCSYGRYVSKSLFASDKQRKTYCSKHRYIPRTRYCFIGEFDDYQEIKVDYYRQGIYEYEKGKNRLHCILSYCPYCNKERWKNVRTIRDDLNTKCMSCSKRRAIKPKPTKGIHITNGYREIHLDIIESDELRELAKKYLKVHRNYVYEHRLIALQKYGPKAVAHGLVIRHHDGDKLNNDPDNLIYGTQKQNIRDHITDRKEMKLLRKELHELKSLINP
jgi:hypothetical protein